MMEQQSCSGDRASSPGSVSAGLFSFFNKEFPLYENVYKNEERGDRRLW